MAGDHLKEFQDDGGDAAKMSGAFRAIPSLADARWFYVGGKAGRVHGCVVWDHEEVAAGVAKERFIGGQGTGIFGEVLVGSKLGWVNEDGGDGDIAGLAGMVDEREVSGMEGSHGRDQADGFPLMAKVVDLLADIVGVLKDLHVRKPGMG